MERETTSHTASCTVRVHRTFSRGWWSRVSGCVWVWVCKCTALVHAEFGLSSVSHRRRALVCCDGHRDEKQRQRARPLDTRESLDLADSKHTLTHSLTHRPTDPTHCIKQAQQVRALSSIIISTLAIAALPIFVQTPSHHPSLPPSIRVGRLQLRTGRICPRFLHWSAVSRLQRQRQDLRIRHRL